MRAVRGALRGGQPFIGQAWCTGVVALTRTELARRLPVEGGWPAWATEAVYDIGRHPQAEGAGSPAAGGNCQVYAYAVLGLFGRRVPPHRSSELWADRDFIHVSKQEAEGLDLVLFNRTADSWGAHVAVVVGGGLLHLSQEVGTPAIWVWEDFAARERYRKVVGLVRVPRS